MVGQAVNCSWLGGVYYLQGSCEGGWGGSGPLGSEGVRYYYTRTVGRGDRLQQSRKRRGGTTADATTAIATDATTTITTTVIPSVPVSTPPDGR